MTTTPVPYPELGLASFDQLDTWTQSFLLAGSDPELLTYSGLRFEMGQSVALGTVLGLNSRGRLVPATVTDVRHFYVVSAVPVAAGDGSGTTGPVTLTGTTGTGTKFQATGTIDGAGHLTAITGVTVEGDYTVVPTDAAHEPVTGGSLVGATVAVVVESREVLTAGVQAAYVATQALVTAAGNDTVSAPVYFSGCFNIRALIWDASFTNDEAKFAAFRGAPTPTQIIVKKRQHDV